MTLRRFSLFACSLALLSLVGCGGGGSGLSVDVTIQNNGAAYTPATGEEFSITLTSTDGKTNSGGGGKLDSSGKLKLEGIAPGTYQVTVRRMTPPDPKAPAKGPPAAKAVPESWEVSSSKKSFTIDLSKLR